MEQQLNAITIAVKDVALLKTFYADTLGWAVLAENPSVAMFKTNQAVFTLCAESIFNDYTGMPAGQGEKGYYFTVNLSSPQNVDESFSKFKTLGVNITKMPAPTFWGGYSGFFADPENNVWEI